jgi:hypothetical protein
MRKNWTLHVYPAGKIRPLIKYRLTTNPITAQNAKPVSNLNIYSTECLVTS